MTQHLKKTPPLYYVPKDTVWPIIGSIGLATAAIGAVNLIHENKWGAIIFFIGAIIIVSMMFGWFHNVIEESQKGLYSAQLDRSFRWGMV